MSGDRERERALAISSVYREQLIRLKVQVSVNMCASARLGFGW